MQLNFNARNNQTNNGTQNVECVAHAQLQVAKSKVSATRLFNFSVKFSEKLVSFSACKRAMNLCPQFHVRTHATE